MEGPCATGHRAGKEGPERVRASDGHTAGDRAGDRRAGDGNVWLELVVGGVVAIVVAVGLFVALHVSSDTSDTAARANLANALVDARAAYDLSRSYSFEGSPLSVLSFDSQDAAFSWSTGSCAGKPSNCVSEQVVDVHSPGDSQGVVLATWSSATATCWYAADLESVPESLPQDHDGTAFDLGSSRGSGSAGTPDTEGIYYARSKPGATTCSAGAALGAGLEWSRSQALDA
jgi:hypothetical protein